MTGQIQTDSVSGERRDLSSISEDRKFTNEPRQHATESCCGGSTARAQESAIFAS